MTNNYIGHIDSLLGLLQLILCQFNDVNVGFGVKKLRVMSNITRSLW